MNPLVEKIAKKFIQKRQTLSLAESCTGGGLAAELVKIPGASKFFLGSIVTYSDQSKMKLLHISENEIKNFGSVSIEVAKSMALGAYKEFGSHWALSITGIAGPDGGSILKPIGTVCFALVHNHKIEATWKKYFSGNREEIISQSIRISLDALGNIL